MDNIKIPFVAIGGIKQNNIAQASKAGASYIFLLTEIVGAFDMSAKVRQLRRIMKENKK